MASMTGITAITRTAAGASARYLEVHKGKEVRQLGTPIIKVVNPEAFVKRAGKTAPIEQYAFKVDGKIVARFADATALVLKKHHVDVDEAALETKQIYLAKALQIMAGTEPLRVVQEEFAAAKEAEPKSLPVEALPVTVTVADEEGNGLFEPIDTDGEEHE